MAAIQHCLGVLYGRVSNVSDHNVPGASKDLLKSVIRDILKLSSGDTQLSNTPPPSPIETPPDRDPTRDESTRQRGVERLLELVEKLKHADGQLISSSTQLDGASRPGDLPMGSPALSDDAAGQLFAKQVTCFLTSSMVFGANFVKLAVSD